MNTLQEKLESFLEYQIQLEGPELILGEVQSVESRVSSLETGVLLSEKVATVGQPALSSTMQEEGNSGMAEPSPSLLNTQNLLSPYDAFHALIPESSPIFNMKTLDELVEHIKTTELIELDKSRIKAVPGVGDPHADLMVIGEAPGAEEDKIGEPFVGRAGKLLTKILQAIGFEREDVYITNILKSRPTNNRDPLPEEKEQHIPFLWKQIALIQPKIILCAGKVSGTTLLNRPKSSLKELRSEGYQDLHGLPVKVTYHPAALLRNPNWKKPTWEDVQDLRRKYDELGGKPSSLEPQITNNT